MTTCENVCTARDLRHLWKMPSVALRARFPRVFRFGPPRDPRYREMFSLLPEALAISALLALIWVSGVIMLAREETHQVETARNNVATLSRIYAESADRIFSDIDLTLRSARTSYARSPAEFDIEHWSDTHIRDDRMRVQISWIDKDGFVVKSTLARSNKRPINIADRPHFRYQLDKTRDELYISDPLIGRGSGAAQIQFSRKLLDGNGQFAGVLVFSLACSELSRFLDLSSDQNVSVSVANAHGVVLAGSPSRETVTIAPTAAMLVDAGDGDDPRSMDKMQGSLAAADAVVATTKVTGYPAYVTVSESREQALVGYWRNAGHVGVVSLLASVVVLVLGRFWISQRRRAMASSRALAATLGGMTQGIAMIDANGVLSVTNEPARRLLTLVGGETVGSSERVALDQVLDTAKPAVTNTSSHTEERLLEYVTDDGRVVEIRVTPMFDGGTVHTFTDVTQQHAAQSRVRYLAHHDILTGLPNRYLLEQKIDAILKQAEASGSSVLVMFIDLDGFKGVNDTLGHEIGDKLLQHVAQVISRTVGVDDFVARLGGDEFIVVRPTSGDVERAATLADTLIERISDSAIVGGHEMRISTSVGISLFPRDGADHHSLFRKADIALYRAKMEGRAARRMFESAMGEQLSRQVMLQEELRAALDAGSLEVHYQPQFKLDPLRIASFEALARWYHPQHGWIPPADFIPVAEESGLIGRLGGFILETACKQAANWPVEVPVAVNVSACQLLDSGFVCHVKDILARTGLPPRRLELELTESVMADAGRHIVSVFEALHDLGVSLALDDFGTGYSSLSNLLRFHFDKVKIDQSFVQEQVKDPEARAILEAILVMSRHIGIEVIAEGVENDEQLELLKEQKCPVVQGFSLGGPASNSKTVELLQDARFARSEFDAVYGAA